MIILAESARQSIVHIEKLTNILIIVLISSSVYNLAKIKVSVNLLGVVSFGEKNYSGFG